MAIAENNPPETVVSEPESTGLSLADAMAQLDQRDQAEQKPEEVETEDSAQEDLDNTEDQELETEGEEEESEESEESDEEEDDEDDSEDSEDDELEGFEFEGEFYPAEQLKEWKESGLRQDDYTRKTQEVAAERKEVEAAKSETAQLNQQYIELLEHQQIALHAQYETAGITDEQLAKVREEHGLEEYINLKESRESQQRTMGQLYQQIQNAKAQQEAYEAEQKQQKLQESYQTLSEKIPEFADPEKGQPLRDGVAKILTDAEFGFTNEELDAIDDPRMFLVAHALYQERANSPTSKQKEIAKKKVQRKVSPVLRKGKPKTQKERTTESRKKIREQNLGKPMSVNDVGALLDQLENN